MAENSGYMLEPLREEADFTLYRGRELGNPMPILALAVAAEHPTPQSPGGSNTNGRSRLNSVRDGRHSPSRCRVTRGERSSFSRIQGVNP
jgi:hypothetical protein